MTGIEKSLQITSSSRPGMGLIPYEDGTTFRIWALHAERAAVAGTFNGWSAGATPLAGRDSVVWIPMPAR
jgi:1,4-alpha-glucan branching enzyme